MTKARSRQRAKAKAADKTKKTAIPPEQVEQRIKPPKFDPGSLSMKGRGMNVNANSFGGARRGAARSK